jgi:uncharacterized damage-inducible protein DinB
MSLGTLRELFAYNDWAWEAVAGLAADLPDAKVDQPFEMGNGSIRATLHHIWAAEKVWLDRWRHGGKPPFEDFDPGRSVAALGDLRRVTCGERDAFMASLGEADLSRRITFTTIRDNATYTLPLAPLMMHVCNHGVHHRAQALNMLKRVGAAVPARGIDYIFMKLHAARQNTGRPPPPPGLSLAMVRTYFAYGDWAQQRVIDAARGLPDPALEQPFDMGIKTIRATLRHITYSEAWWLTNWTTNERPHYDDSPPSMSVADLFRLHAEHTAARDAFRGSLCDADLGRIVQTQPSPGKTFAFPLGESMLQLCHHGTHHRAQALNMLRHAGAAHGATPPGIDLLTWQRDTAGGQPT